jgi:peptidyl-prolyl cis-trans isomerase B (cyclophilin B)
VALGHRLPLIAVVALAGCGGGGGGDRSAATTTAGGCTAVSKPAAKARHEPKPTQRLDASKTYDVAIETNCGTFTIRLDVKAAPATTASFVSLARKRYFDRTVFHRIVPGFVIQGGDPTATGTGGPGYLTVDKPRAGARYVRGVVAMAKTQQQPAGTSGSQFFVVTGDDAQLPPDYAIIGKVAKGLDVVDRIGELGDPSTQQPTEVVEIEHATVHVS